MTNDFPSPYCDNAGSNSLIINDDIRKEKANCPDYDKSTTASLNVATVAIVSNGTNEKPPYGTASNNDNVNCESKSDLSLAQMIHLVLVVVASSTINGVVFGVVNNFGVFYVYLIELFKADTSLLVLGTQEEPLMPTELEANNTAASNPLLQPLIAGVGSLNIGLIFFCSIFASVLSDRYGIRQVCFVGGILSTIGMYASSVSINLIYLYITYGLVLGIGASLVYAPSLAILGHYFTKRLGLVNGLVTAGSSVFSIVMPIVLRRSIESHGVQTTFKYLTILMAVLILCSLTFKEKIKKSPPTPNRGVGSFGSRNSLTSYFYYDELWKNRLYVFWLISIPTGLFGYFVPFCHLVKHANDINSAYGGEFLVMSIGIFSMVGRLISGPLADFSKVNRIALQQIAFVSIGVLTMLLPVVRDFWLLAACCGLGLFDGCFISLIGPIAFDLVGPEYANQAIGLLLCFCSLPLTTGPPIAAYAYGIYGNYKLAFFMAGIPPIFAAILMVNIILAQRRKRQSSSALCTNVNSNGNSFCVGNLENGEKIHLLNNKNSAQILNGLGSSSKLRLSVSCGSGEDSEQANLLKSSNGAIIFSISDNHQSAGENAKGGGDGAVPSMNGRLSPIKVIST